MSEIVKYRVKLPTPHERQGLFIDSKAKRKIIRAGRRGGKTVGNAIYATKKFLEGRRVLYGVPTSDQMLRFWTTITRALAEPIERGLFYKNETEHVIELKGTEQRIRAKTAWNADTLRGDYADELILDEWQLMNEDTWELVGAPMMLDTNGNATFIYTPPSLHSRSVTKANDPMHAAKMYKRALLEMMAAAKEGRPARWEAFHFTSRDNPHLSTEALDDIMKDMTDMAYRMEILAEDIDEAPSALWKRKTLEDNRVEKLPDTIDRIIVGVDPSGTSRGDAIGIVTAASSGDDIYVIEDSSLHGSPLEWGTAVKDAYHKHGADIIVAEGNFGGEMVDFTLKTVDPSLRVKMITASRGKAVRAEPVAALYEKGHGHHVGAFPALEDEMCMWMIGDASPNRMDALVWAVTELVNSNGKMEMDESPLSM